MSITYQVEKYSDVRESITPLGEANFLEGDARNACADIDIDWDLYDSLEEAGSAILITARKDSVLVGYLSLSMATHPHIKDFIQASSDALYVAPECRGSDVGGGLLLAAEHALREAGVDWISLFFRNKEVSKNLMERLYYEQTDVVFGKSLGDK